MIPRIPVLVGDGISSLFNFYNVKLRANVCLPMEGQVPASQPPEFNTPAPINPDNLEAMKEQARRMAIAQAMQERPVIPQPNNPPAPPFVAAPRPQPQPQVVYVRRNLTVAEVGLLVLLSVGLLAGGQFIWNVSTDLMSRIEIREK